VNKNGAARRDQTDDLDRVLDIGAQHALTLTARTTFTGLGQANPPRPDPVYQVIALRKLPGG
jgi:hypothetical protein